VLSFSLGLALFTERPGLFPHWDKSIGFPSPGRFPRLPTQRLRFPLLLFSPLTRSLRNPAPTRRAATPLDEKKGISPGSFHYNPPPFIGTTVLQHGLASPSNLRGNALAPLFWISLALKMIPLYLLPRCCCMSSSLLRPLNFLHPPDAASLFPCQHLVPLSPPLTVDREKPSIIDLFCWNIAFLLGPLSSGLAFLFFMGGFPFSRATAKSPRPGCLPPPIRPFSQDGTSQLGRKIPQMWSSVKSLLLLLSLKGLFPFCFTSFHIVSTSEPSRRPS